MKSKREKTSGGGVFNWEDNTERDKEEELNTYQYRI